MVLQERMRWLTLADLTDREKQDLLDMPVVPEGVFGSALASMQRRCEATRKEDEALQLCLPFLTAAAQGSYACCCCCPASAVSDPEAAVARF